MRCTNDCISRLGSRLHLLLDPAGRRAFLPTYGRFEQTPLDVFVGLETPAGDIGMPWSARGATFGQLEQETTMTTVSATGIDIDSRTAVSARFVSPFYPQDERLSTAPFFYVDIELRKTPFLRWRRADDTRRDTGRLVVELSGEGIALEGGADRVDLSFVTQRHTQLRPEHEAQAGILLPPMTIRHTVRVLTPGATIEGGRISLPYDLREASPDDAPVVLRLLWTAWEDGAPLYAQGEWTRFKYTRLFDSDEDVARYAIDHRDDIEAKCRFFDKQITDWSLGIAASRLTALAFHSFLINTWWTITEGGRDWFSVWEGVCYYHSTIDVEYNDAFVYLALWPGLLKMLLDQWPSFVEPGETVLGEAGRNTLFFCHDTGSGAMADRQHYHHPMPVEENTNYLLLLLAYCTHTGDLAPLRDHADTVRKAADFMLACDTTGNGFVDEGGANTIDDASPAVQYGREQTYLAVKCLAAIEGLLSLDDVANLGFDRAKYRNWTRALRRTLERKAWLGDHYAVTLTRTTEGIVDAWTGEPLPPGELEGWDAYSIYTANGSLFTTIAGLDLGLKKARLFDDLDSATRHTMTPIGSRHSSSGKPIVWISQNLWRDVVGAYLGLDLLNNVERYWDYQVQQGASDAPTLFYDTTLNNNLCCYPRGIASLGLVYAASGLVLNRLGGVLETAPLRDTLDVPLLPLADWAKRHVPWLRVRRKGRRRVVTVE